MEGRLLEKSA